MTRIASGRSTSEAPFGALLRVSEAAMPMCCDCGEYPVVGRSERCTDCLDEHVPDLWDVLVAGRVERRCPPFRTIRERMAG